MSDEQLEMERKGEVLRSVLKRFEAILPCRIRDYSCVHNKISLVCTQKCLDDLLDYYAYLDSCWPPAKKFEGQTREELQKRWERTYSLNLWPDPDAPEEGYFVDDWYQRVDEEDAQGWRGRLMRWTARDRQKEVVDFWYEVLTRVRKLKEEVVPWPVLAPYVFVCSKKDYARLEEACKIIKYSRYICNPESLHELVVFGIGADIKVRPYTRSGGHFVDEEGGRVNED